MLELIVAGGESTDELVEMAWGLRRILGAVAIAESLGKLLVKEVRKKKWNRVIEWRSGWNISRFPDTHLWTCDKICTCACSSHWSMWTGLDIFAPCVFTQAQRLNLLSQALPLYQCSVLRPKHLSSFLSLLIENSLSSSLNLLWGCPTIYFNYFYS